MPSLGADMDRGRLVEEGTHATLMADPDSVYARFHRLQGDNGLGLVADDGAGEAGVGKPSSAGGQAGGGHARRRAAASARRKT